LEHDLDLRQEPAWWALPERLLREQWRGLWVGGITGAPVLITGYLLTNFNKNHL